MCHLQMSGVLLPSNGYKHSTSLHMGYSIKIKAKSRSRIGLSVYFLEQDANPDSNFNLQQTCSKPCIASLQTCSKFSMTSLTSLQVYDKIAAS